MQVPFKTPSGITHAQLVASPQNPVDDDVFIPINRQIFVLPARERRQRCVQDIGYCNRIYIQTRSICHRCLTSDAAVSFSYSHVSSAVLLFEKSVGSVVSLAAAARRDGCLLCSHLVISTWRLLCHTASPSASPSSPAYSYRASKETFFAISNAEVPRLPEHRYGEVQTFVVAAS